MRSKGTYAVYGLLVALWCAIGLWQVVEHLRVRESARTSLYRRAMDISNTVGVVIRSQWFFVPQSRLEDALQLLAGSQDLRSVALLNSTGQVVASGGQPIADVLNDFPESAERWDNDTLTVVNPVDLGTGMDRGDEKRPPVVIVPDEEMRPPSDAIRSASGSERLPPPFPPPPPRWDHRRPREDSEAVPSAREDRPEDGTHDFSGPGGRGNESRPRPDGRRPRRFGRPPGMSEEKYKELLDKKGLHGFVLVMSTEAFKAATRHDLWLRLVMMGVASVAAAGLGMAWRSTQRSAHLQIRLVRASEMNERLREMNVAAAGLAHETRNPLNIVRGLAQMISTCREASTEVRGQAKDITEEVDRVAARLNEFIEYSRPPETRPAPRHLNAVIRDVERTLESDKEEKSVEFSLSGPELVVEADESSLRQVLFNLMLNAIQAVGKGGRIEVAVQESGADEAFVEVRDNGPGVPEEVRQAIFRPYFTTHEGGTGLGLAVVRQIVLANGWEVEHTPRKEGGAAFRVQGLKVISRIS